MVKERNERIKMVITLVLAIILIISGYFRLIHAKSKGNDSPSKSLASAPARIPKVEIPKPAETAQKEMPNLTLLESAVRDIFSRVEKPVPDDALEDEKPKTPPPGGLKGTIVGGEKPIAIINGRFVRAGDWVGEYQVVEIDKDRVLLRSGNHQVELEVLKHVQK